ncbi:MAG: nucleoside 2-deoxyribosyltransferase [Candidatus Kariarchaeaceae archaeon]
MKIYFAGSIRAGRDDVNIYTKIIMHLKQYGEVLTEHVGDSSLDIIGEEEGGDSHIYERDMEWLLKADLIIAEVTQPSLGVGYEIGRAVAKKMQVLCLYRKQSGRRLSAMIAGNPNLSVFEYTELDQVFEKISQFIT